MRLRDLSFRAEKARFTWAESLNSTLTSILSRVGAASIHPIIIILRILTIEFFTIVNTLQSRPSQLSNLVSESTLLPIWQEKKLTEFKKDQAGSL